MDCATHHSVLIFLRRGFRSKPFPVRRVFMEMHAELVERFAAFLDRKVGEGFMRARRAA
jgi:hypothetical protein